MVQKTETLIIGGGAIGVCCAFYLNALGKKVLLVEKNDICSGSSYGNAGLIVPSYSIPLAAPGVIGQGLKWMTQPDSPFYIKPRLDWRLLSWLWKFRAFCSHHHVRQSIPVLRDLHTASFNLFEDLAEIDSMDFALEKKGLLELYLTRKEYDKGSINTQLLQEYGVDNKVLSQNELSEFLEGINTPAVGGAYRPHDVHLIPDRFVHQLADHLGKTGVRLMTSCEVLDFEISGRRVSGIKSTRGNISAEEIVVAGGAWSADLVRNLQLNLLMQPAKGYSITFRRTAQCPVLPVSLAESKVVITPMADMLRIAGTLELAGFDQSISLDRVQAILKSVREYLPDLDPDALELLEIWQGLRPCSPDGLPYIGRTPRYDNVILATGHGMLGISLAPITGKIVSQLSANETPDINPAALSVERFG